MYRRRSARRGFGRKRSVAWTPGFSGLDQSNSATALAVSFTNTIGNVYTAAFTLTADSDLQLHGGEDAVVVRMSYELYFFNSTVVTATAHALPARILWVQGQQTATGAILPIDYTSSAGLGRDDILHTRDTVLHRAGSVDDSGTNIGGPVQDNWLRGDIKVRRKLQSGNHIFMLVQTCKDGASIPSGFSVCGNVRTLLMRPR